MLGKMLKETREASSVSLGLVFRGDEGPEAGWRILLVVGRGEEEEGVKRAKTVP